MAGGLIQMSKMGGEEGVNISETAALHGALRRAVYTWCAARSRAPPRCLFCKCLVAEQSFAIAQ